MVFKEVLYKNIDKSVWNDWISNIPEASYYHTWSWINFVSQFAHVKENTSFVLLDEKGKIVAACPLAVSFLKQEGANVFTFGGHPCGVPALVDLSPSLHRKVLDKIFNIFAVYAEKYQIKKINLAQHPLNFFSCADINAFSNRNSFELLRYNLLYQVENTIVINLKLSEKELISQISRYHYRHITRSRKTGVSVRVFNKNNNFTECKNYFDDFQQAHFTSSGKLTRPQITWDVMYDNIQQGEASLFVAFFENQAVSYLYCGEFSLMAFGWSQVNIEKFEEKLSPRHLLEWEAIMFYKKKGFRYYEIGERYFAPQLLRVPTAKEISISIFKERYGGILLPKINWVGYYDLAYMENICRKQLNNFLLSQPLVKTMEGPALTDSGL